MKLAEKAESSPDVSLARQSAPGVYRLTTDDLVSADELTDEGEFPEFGDFLEVEKARGTSAEDASWGPSQFIECPQGLARWLVENIDVGDGFRVVSVQKVDGEWQYDCDEFELDEDDQDEDD